MNAKSPEHERDELEVRLTALLLGELDPAEAAQLNNIIANDPGLAETKARLERTIMLVREAIGQKGAQENLSAQNLRLSHARRKRITALFDNTRRHLVWCSRALADQWYVSLGLAAALVMLIGLAGLLVSAQRAKFSPAVKRVLSHEKQVALAGRLVSTQPHQLRKETEDLTWGVPQDAAQIRARRFSSPAAAGGDQLSEESAVAPEGQAEKAGVRLYLPSESPPSEAIGKGVGEAFSALVPSTTGLAPALRETGTPTEAKKNGDIRMLMRYGLLPKGSKSPVDEQAQQGNAVPKEPAGPVTVPHRQAVTTAAQQDLKPADRGPAGRPSSVPSSLLPSALAVGASTIAPVAKSEAAATAGLSVAPQGATDRDDKASGGLGDQVKPVYGVQNGSPAARGHITERYVALVDKDKSGEVRKRPVLGDEASVGVMFGEFDDGLPETSTNVLVPQPEVVCTENPVSTFSLNISDVSFRLAVASLENGTLPAPSSIRSEEFINAFDYRDPDPAAGMPLAFHWERARYPFAHNRDVVRFAIKTAASGRDSVRPLNLVLLVDTSGSMERADRVLIMREAVRVLSQQLRPEDVVSVVGFARTARLWVDALPGNRAGELIDRVGSLTPEGGTNLEDALKLAYETAARHFLPGGVNRIVLLTDGAANLGDVDPDSLKRMVTEQRRRGIALDCFGIGWEGYNDELLEILSRNGDGRYAFLSTPEEAATDFAAKLAGSLQVAAADVKVQVEFNPRRVVLWRQIGYAKHQLAPEQFRDDTVDAAEIASAESGNALYVIQTDPSGDGNICVVRVRYREPASGLHREMSWQVPYTGVAVPLENAGVSLRLAVVAAAFSEWLASSPHATEVRIESLLSYLKGVPEAFELDPRPRKLEWMLRECQRISGK